MEEVLVVYTRPRDPDCPLVCLDETSKQLIAETRVPIPMKPGRPARFDCEYERNGTANLFMLFAPLEGWRHSKVTDRHTAVDYAHVLKDLADVHFPHAKTIVLVQDNLNIHAKASLYEAFPAAEARRLVERFEWHYTPKHGSWLNLAESELGVLSSQCLDRRIPDKETLSDEVAAWEHDRNANHTKADWHFTTSTARVKLKGAVAGRVGIRRDAASGGLKVSVQAARSIGRSMTFVVSVCQPSTFRMLIWPEASRAQNNMAAVSADGSTVCVLIRRLNSSWRRSMAFEVLALRHCDGGKRVKANRASPASSRLSATARCRSRHLRTKALRRSAISSAVAA